MINPDPPAGGTLESLLEVMPRIADAVNAFTSEENQQVAMRACMRMVGLNDESPGRPEAVSAPNLSVVPPAAGDPVDIADPSPASETSQGTPPTARQRRPRKAASKRAWSPVKEIDFRPAGKQSLRDFAEEKLPVSQHEKNLVCVHYLEEVLGLSSVGAGHVLAAYEECGWKLPASPENSLQRTSCLKKWLETGDMQAIHVTLRGRNAIQYDLPAKKSA
jgi:hypothetical protein